jgi:hypothetical protein
MCPPGLCDIIQSTLLPRAPKPLVCIVAVLLIMATEKEYFAELPQPPALPAVKRAEDTDFYLKGYY